MTMLSEIDERAIKKRRLRLQKEITEEEERIRSYKDAEEQKIFKERALEAERRFAEEYARQKADELTKEAELKQIRAQSDEIKDLEQKLQAAYMNKKRDEQLQEKKLLDAEQKVRDEQQEAADAAFRDMELKRAGDPEELRLKKLEDNKRAMEMHKHLKEIAEQEKYQQFLKEKAMVDAAVQQFNDAVEREEMERLQKQKDMQNFIEQYMREREEYKRQEKEKLANEDDKIREYAAQIAQREADADAKKKEKADEQRRIYEQLAAAVTHDRAEREEMEALLLQLEWEKDEAKRRQKEKDDEEKRLRLQAELLAAANQVKREKAERKQREKEEDEAFKRKMMAKFAEDDRLDQLNQQRRKQKEYEHRKEAERLVLVKRQMELEEEEAEKKKWEEEKARQDHKRWLIQQERLRLLKEHAVKLWGYLPKGTIQTDEELGVFPAEMQREFLGQSQRPVDPKSVSISTTKPGGWTVGDEERLFEHTQAFEAGVKAERREKKQREKDALGSEGKYAQSVSFSEYTDYPLPKMQPLPAVNTQLSQTTRTTEGPISFKPAQTSDTTNVRSKLIPEVQNRVAPKKPGDIIKFKNTRPW